MLLGANGCGKSTTLRVIAGLLNPDAGTFHLDRPFGMVFQNPDHQVVLPTVAADVAFGLGRYNLTSEQVTAAVHHALERVSLSSYSDRPTSSLSGGQKQRVAIAGALAENPRVLLLDELTTFLDARDQRNVLECVRGLVDSKKKNNTTSIGSGTAAEIDNPVTALWVTHRLEELEFADGVSIMDGGKVIFNGTPSEALGKMKRLGANI
jgi:energy-coupling factor transport system ATP-binding protein